MPMLWILKLLIGVVLTCILGVVAMTFGVHKPLPLSRDYEDEAV